MKHARPKAKLAEAQFELARSYGVASWPPRARMSHGAICRDDVEAVRAAAMTVLLAFIQRAR